MSTIIFQVQDDVSELFVMVDQQQQVLQFYERWRLKKQANIHK